MTLLAQRPIAPQERSLFPDLLRGFALLGILLANIQMMSAPYETQTGGFQLWRDEANRWTSLGVDFFVSCSFYPLFAMLFGMGFHLLMRKREQAGHERGAGIYWRRLAVLAGFGALHIGLLWFGDVLLLYALAGCVLPAFWRCREKTLWIWATGLFALPLVFLLLILGLTQMAYLTPDGAAHMDAYMAEEAAALIDRTATLTQAYAQGGFVEVAAARWDEYLSAWINNLLFLPHILGAMLLGLIVGKRGALTSPAGHGAFFRRVLWVGVPLALIGKGLFAVGNDRMGFVPDLWLFLSTLGMCFGGPALMLVYVALLRHALLREWWPRLRLRVAAAGRMPLTNYLAQSLVAALLFHGYGLGLYGSVNIWQGVLLAIGIYAVQLIVSPLWLRRFALGPLEWVWRRLTYGTIRPPAVPPTLPPPLPVKYGAAGT